MSKSSIDRAIMNLLSRANHQDKPYYGGKRFYAYLLMSMRKFYDVEGIPTAAVSITNTINLYINTKFFESLTEQQRVEVLEHECKHIFNFHQKRYTDLDEKDMKLWNIACDAAINEPLTSLHEMGVTANSLKKMIPDLKNNESSEYYYKKLKEYREENGGKNGKGQKDIEENGETIDDHSKWGESEENTDGNEENGYSQIDEVKKQVIKRAMQDAVEKCEGRGNVPMDILKALDKLNQPTVNWKQQLKRFFAKADKFDKKPTRKKLNRRYRHLNPGRRKDPITHIAIGIDNSGSVCDNLFMQFFSEIEAAYNVGNIRFTIIQADCDVNSVIEYSPKAKIERTGGGGTAYNPAIDKAKELKIDGMIYFGDGDNFGEIINQPKFPFLWAIEDGRKAPCEWGNVCYVKELKND